MTLAEMIAALDYELQDTGTIWADAERTRAIQKTVNLMSRLLPKRSVIESIITRTIADETLTIASSTGTLAYKPIKKGSLVITGEIEGTDYTVNYLTGVVTEIGSLLADGDYTANYELDPQAYDLSEISLTDYIKIESIEYPVGDTPISKPTFDVVDGFIILRGSTTFTEDDHIRITYLKKWTAPIDETEWAADTVTHLHDYIIPTAANTTGYIYECTVRASDFKTHATTEPTWGIVVGGTTTDDAITWTCRESASDYPTHLDDIVIIGSAGQCLIYKAELYVQSAVSALSTITAVAAYTFVKPTPATIPAYTVMTALVPTPVVPVFTAAETALTAIGTAITAAIAYLTTGATYLSTFSWDDRAVADLGSHAGVAMEAAGHRVNEAIARLRQIEDSLTRYAAEVTAYGSTVNAYANNISGLTSRQREEVNAEVAAVQDYISRVQYYSAQVANQEMKARNFLDIAGRYLASGQAKINEFLVALGFKPEFGTQRAMSEQRS